jgi:hypothetical protein
MPVTNMIVVLAITTGVTICVLYYLGYREDTHMSQYCVEIRMQDNDATKRCSPTAVLEETKDYVYCRCPKAEASAP